MREASQQSKRETEPQARRPIWLDALDRAALGAFACVWGYLLLALPDPASGTKLGLTLLALLPGYLLADFASGVVHWFSDTYFREDTPILGAAVIAPFREHHRDPSAILRHGFVERVGNSALATLPLGVGFLWLTAGGVSGAATTWLVFAAVLAFWTALFALLTNQLHCWAHAPSVPKAVAWLQGHQLILSPARHQHHHRGANDAHYCVASGWLNPLLDRVHFFRRLERLADSSSSS